MLTKKHRVIHVKTLAKKYTIPIRIMALTLIVLSGALNISAREVAATGCPDLKVIFIRGSGGKRYTSKDYLTFKRAMEQKLNTSSLQYIIDDLDYPAASIDISEGHLDTFIGAYIGGGEAYKFGDSVHAGTKSLIKAINDNKCKDTKYVIAGYSQGTIVLLDALNSISANKIIFAATFGDPKIYLPEGAGLVPKACSGKNLSSYRIHVPDCRAYKGMLGAKRPYIPSSYQYKYGTWCNKKDILCSSRFSISDHTAYVEDGLYEDASRFIFAKVAKAFNFKNEYTSPHDTAIIINSTSSIPNKIPQFKVAVYDLASRTFEAGGRVALYDYHGSANSFTPTKRCDFSSCTLADIKVHLDDIENDLGPQSNNALLSNSFQVMRQLNWRFGSTKSLAIFTDANYDSSGLGGVKFYDVQKLSKQIDPVNFYIMTNPENVENYQSLAKATDGQVFSSENDSSIFVDAIMSRYDSLPRVEEEFPDESYDHNYPSLRIDQIDRESNTSAKVFFTSTGSKTIVILNDTILGVTNLNHLTLTDLRNDHENTLTLVPILNDYRGEPVSTKLNSKENEIEPFSLKGFMPKAPNTGRQ